MSESSPQLTETEMTRALVAMGIEIMDDPRPTREIAIQYGVIAVEAAQSQGMVLEEIPRSAILPNLEPRRDNPYFVK